MIKGTKNKAIREYLNKKEERIFSWQTPMHTTIDLEYRDSETGGASYSSIVV